MNEIHVTSIYVMAGRKKGSKCRERVQVHATFTFQQATTPEVGQEPGGKKDPTAGGEEDKDRDKDRDKDKVKVPKVVASERLSFAEHAIKILDHMMKERSVGELLKLGPREEMLGLTPLSMAAAVGHVEGTRKLLEAGANVDDISNDGSTALLNAAHWRHLPVLDLLLQHGASVAAINNEGNNALMVALRHGDVRAVNSLWPHRKSLDINHANNDGYTAVHLAAERKWESCVQFLIQNGANVNKQTNSGQTALHIASSKGDQPTAERLLAAGASLLLEDHCGNNPFCLAVRGFHDFLAGYFLTKLKPEDKLYFCKRRVHQLQSQLSADSCSAWNAVSFLTSDPSLRDALYQCDVIRIAVQALGRRGVVCEVAVQSCLMCSDLMYNPFPIPDLRFVKQFLAAHGPEAVLDRLDSRGQEHVHNLDCKELTHLQGHMQGQLQNRQQQVDFNTAFILLPIMAMAETSIGRNWFAEATNQQRLAIHLRRVTSYRELLQLVSVVQQEMCTREVKVDRVAVMERFIAFFNTLENRDHEEKVRQLLEQEEREKSRKEKKREKKRQQRLKQKLKTKASEMPDEASNKDGPGIGEAFNSKSQSLDALDEIPLTVGPDGVQDVPNPASAVVPSGTGQDVQGNENEWVMVGGKRCYPSKLRTSVPAAREDYPRDQDPFRMVGDLVRSSSNYLDSSPSSQTDGIGSVGLPITSQSAQLNDCNSLDVTSAGIRSSIAVDSNSKANKGGMRWADVARHGSPCAHIEDALSSSNPNPDPELELPTSERSTAKPTHKKREGYREQFPCLGQQTPLYDSSGIQTSATETPPQANYGVEVLGAAHQFLEKLCHTSGLIGRMPRVAGNSGQSSILQSSNNSRLSPNALYEALTGWMWQAAVAQGLIASSDNESPLRFTPSDVLKPLTNQFLKPKSAVGNLQNVNENPANVCIPSGKSASYTKLTDFVNKQSTRCVLNTQSPVSPRVKDWFDVTNTNSGSTFASKSSSSFQRLSEHNQAAYKITKNQVGAGGPVTSNSISAPALAIPHNSFDTFPLTKDRRTSSQTAGSAQNEDPFLWTGSSFTHWLPSYSGKVAPDASVSSRVSGKPVLDSSDLYGVPATTSLDSSRSLEFPVSRHSQLWLGRKLDSPKDFTGKATSSTQPYQDEQDESLVSCKATKSATDHYKHIPVLSNMTTIAAKERTAPTTDYAWLTQDSAKPGVKTATVSVPRSSDSDSTQSSPTEQKSEAVVDDVFSLTSDTSRSSCLNNDSFHQLSPSNSAASSFTGLHECLAPGFLRAATGDTHMRSFGIMDEVTSTEEAKSNVFRPVLGSIGLLPTSNGGAEGDLNKRLDRQYPDLSTVPEREQSFPTTLSKASRVVGHGRPQRSQATNIMNYSSSEPVDLTQTQASEDNSTTAATEGVTSSEGGISLNVLTPSETVLAQHADRPPSPDVLFPESLRDDEGEEQSKSADVFPSIHDMNERDLFQDVFSNSYFLEQIAIDQIRRRLRSMGDGEEILKTNSVLFHDLDYYASLYGVRLRDILGPQVEAKPSRQERETPKKTLDQSVPAWKAVVKELGRRMNSKEDLRDAGDLELPADWEDTPVSEWPWSCKMTPPQIVTGGDSVGDEGWWQEGGGSRRWRTWLRQILDMPWTMRRQYGKIVLPARSMEFNIGRTGRHPLILGFLTDGTEVGVLALDRTRHALDTRLMATVAADSEPDVHFVLRYKAVWECAGRVYLAMELCDYTLDEYVGIVRLDHRQDPLSANRLAWQMLKGLKYLHSNFAVPHGNLMPGWIFVDCDGRLRLAGYGLRDVTASTRSGCRESSERNSIEGDSRYWRATDHPPGVSAEPSFQADIQVAGMLLHYILTGGRHPYGDTGPEVEANLSRNVIRQHRVSQEADHLVSIMTVSDPMARPSVDTCLKHPFFWSGEKRFRLVLIVGSDILTEMKAGVPLTGAGSTSMVDILNIIHINSVSDNWLSEVDPVLVKEMRAFRQYKNTLPELVLFVYNCCLHYDKMSTVAKEVLDDPCKYFQSRFTGLFMAVYRAMRASDRTDRTCYKPFF